MTSCISFLPLHTLEVKTILTSLESNPGEQAPQADSLSITPLPLGQFLT